MTETAKLALGNDLGCGFLGAFFQRGGLKLRKASAPPLPGNIGSNHNADKSQSALNSKKRCGSVCDMAVLDSLKPAKPSQNHAEIVPRRKSVSPRTSNCRDQDHGRRHSDAVSRKSTSSIDKPRLSEESQVVISDNIRKLRKEAALSASELSLTVAAVPKSNATDAPVPASTGNIMLLAHLGNLKQKANKKSSGNRMTQDSSPRSTQMKENVNGTSVPTLIMGNILKKPAESNQQLSNTCRSLMNKLDPDGLKSLGNQKYKQGRLEEALALYNQAIALDSSKAAYFSNKSAALMGLGHLIEAVFACREAIQIEPNYHNAHYRLAKLYFRLGKAEEAIFHFKNAEPKAYSREITEAQALKIILGKCSKARKLRDWNSLLNESQRALSSGADSAPQIYAMKAEALLNLHKHEEAYATLQTCTSFDAELSTSLFGSSSTAYSLVIRCQVYLAAGRFEDAVSAAHDAARIDHSDEVNITVKKVQAVTTARLNGNRLFKASKFLEASIAYTEGLDIQPYNSVLLCNRAACRSKLGQYEKAVEDCTAALNVHPCYNKARLRRADCNAKMERWKAAILDYEVLMQESPKDEELNRRLLEAYLQLHKQHNEGIKEQKTSLNALPLASYEHLTLVAANLAASKC